MLIKQKKKGKKAVSVVIGYVLLVVFAIVISAGVYAWLKTYVPSEPLNCPDGVSLFIKDARFNSSTSKLNVTVRNNGRFDVAGYFIHATNSSTQELPSIDLSSYLVEDSEGIKFGNSVLHSVTGTNSLKPGEERRNSFNIPSAVGNIYSIRIIPTKFQEENNRERFVSCGDSRVQQIVGAPNAAGGACVPNCAGKICGSDGCGGSCGICSTGTCNVTTGQCVLGGGVTCGNTIIESGEQCDDGNTVNTDACTNSCRNAVCGDGIIRTGIEQCDDGNVAPGDGCSSTCTVEAGYSCVPNTTPPPASICSAGSYDITDYCRDLGEGWGGGTCVANTGGCVNQNGELRPGGDIYCSPSLGCCTSPSVLQLAYFGFESNTPTNQGWANPFGSDSDRVNSVNPGSKVLDNGANGGTWLWRIRNFGSNAYTEHSFDFSGANQIKLEWWGRYNGLESNEKDCLVLQVDNNNVSSWGTLTCNNSITQNSWIAQSIIINSSQHTFDNSVIIRFKSYMDSTSDNFYFDGFNVTRIS